MVKRIGVSRANLSDLPEELFLAHCSCLRFNHLHQGSGFGVWGLGFGV